VLLDKLSILMVVYHGTARWSAGVHYSMQAVHQIGVHVGVHHSTSQHITYRPLSCASNAHPGHFLSPSALSLGLRSDVIHNLVPRTTPVCIASYPWRMTDAATRPAAEAATPKGFIIRKLRTQEFMPARSPSRQFASITVMACPRLRVVAQPWMRCHAYMRRPCAPGLTSCVPKDEDTEGFRLPPRHGTRLHGFAFDWRSASHAKVRPYRLVRSLNGGNSPSTVASHSGRSGVSYIDCTPTAGQVMH
jgi:hypothetical protein